jgi:hypothetical protein
LLDYLKVHDTDFGQRLEAEQALSDWPERTVGSRLAQSL